jgi:diguanylate cyclase (GGDEF)-like protein
MLAMLMIDVDDFKRVNDAHGHDAGDRMLVAVAERLKECVRADATIARLGGDEFAILLEGLTDDAAALVVAQRVVRAFDRPLRIEGATVPGRVSVGVAVDVTGKRPASWLLRSADTAMYEAKRLGKGRWRAYDPAAHLASAKRLVLENELRRAVDRKQFVLAYQPITDLRTGDIVGSEALIRWNHPTKGLVLPGEFISVLEATGLIEPVGRWVVDEAVRQAAHWQGTLPSLAWTSVNVSSAQLRSDDFYACVRDALATHALDPAHLTLEVTESLALDDAIETVERLTALRALGVRIAVDDFGTGYSSLAYLRRLPIDKLKIDRAFIDGIGSDAEATAVARAIVELAKSLHLSTIAEGIEHRHQAETLVKLGCELGQGYLFAKPLQAPDLAALVAGRIAAARSVRTGSPERLAS